MPLLRRLGQPADSLLHVLEDILTFPVKLAQKVFRIWGVRFCRSCEPRQGFFNLPVFQEFFGQTIGGKLVPMLSGLGQPADALLPVMDFYVIGQQQFAQCVLCVRQLPRRLFKPIPRFHPVRYEQRAILVQPAQEKLGIGITVLRLLSEMLHPFITQIQREGVVTDYRPCPSTGFAAQGNIVQLIAPCHIPVLKGELLQTERRLDDGIVYGPEFLLLGQWDALHGLVRVELIHLMLKLQPFLIAFLHEGQPRHLIHNFIHLFFHTLGQIAVLFFALRFFQVVGQREQERFYLRVFADAMLHFISQLQHNASGFSRQHIPRLAFLLIDVKHLLPENIVGQLGLDFLNAHRAEISRRGPGGPRHHVDVGVVALVVERRVPAEIAGWNVHRGGDIIAVCAKQIPP